MKEIEECEKLINRLLKELFKKPIELSIGVRIDEHGIYFDSDGELDEHYHSIAHVAHVRNGFEEQFHSAIANAWAHEDPENIRKVLEDGECENPEGSFQNLTELGNAIMDLKSISHQLRSELKACKAHMDQLIEWEEFRY